MGIFDFFGKKKGAASKEIAVTFMRTDGNAFARSRVPLERLPETFALSTTFHLGEDDWHVVKAEPETAAEFSRSGKLILTVAKVEEVPIEDIFFSLPTISGEFPAIDGPAPDSGHVLHMHEDDWRQAEFYPAGDLPAVRETVERVADVWQNHRREADGFTIFDTCHARKIPPPGLDLDVKDVLAFLAPERQGVVAVSGGCVRNCIALNTRHSDFYCIVENGRVTTIAIHEPSDAATPEIEALASRFGLVFVNWPACEVLPA